MVKKILFLLLISVFAILTKTNATHLVGGSLTYTYLGKSGNDNLYSIKVTMFRDCKHPDSFATPFDPIIDIGFYEDKQSNPFRTTLSLTLSLDSNVAPSSQAVNCKTSVPKCIKMGIYKQTIKLPNSAFGYHIQYIRCCRNTLINLPQNEGQTYYAFIPPTAYQNSSPDFAEPPAAFICAGDSETVLNLAKDPDGDSLTYTLVHPYAGGDAFNPNPKPGLAFSPLQYVSYNTGYSFVKPFGNTGYAKIDPVTGVTSLRSLKTGNFAIAYDVAEYRNGLLISKVRLDVQIIVINCPYNPPPVMKSPVTLSEIKYDYTVWGGEELKFDIEVKSEDTVFLTSSGDIFDPKSTIPKPKATLPDTGGNKNLRTTFRWDTDCSHIRPQPYYFYVKVSDAGCPPKAVIKDFKVTVLPFKGTDKINGPDSVCENQWAIYSVTGKPGSRFEWKVENGLIGPSTQDPNSIQVLWGKSPSGKVKALEISKDGCPGDTAVLNVTLLPTPKTPKIAGSENVCIKSTNIFTLESTKPGSTYFWNINGGKQIQGGNTASITVEWDPLGDSAYISVTERSGFGCIGDTFSVFVIKTVPKVNKISGSLSVCPHSKGIDYWVDEMISEGSTFTWEVQGGTIVSPLPANGHSIKINWAGKDTGIIKVVETTKYGCIGDTVSLDVVIDYKLITPPIQGDTSVCEFTKGEIYSVPFTNNSTYTWQVIGGTIVSGNGSNSIIVDWDAAVANGFLTVTETAYDSINNLPCLGLPVDKIITINPLPTTPVINGADSFCEKDTITYSTAGLPGSKFIWNINDAKAQVLSNDSSGQFKVHYPAAGSYIISVYEVSKDSCISPKNSLNVTANPRPVTSEIIGDTIICAPDFDGFVYSVTGDALSTFSWVVTGGEIVSGQLSDKIIVNWKTPGNASIKVLETSDQGCIGEEKSLQIKLDSSAIILNVVTTQIGDDGIIELNWNINNNNTFNNSYYHIYRRVDGSNSWELADSVPNTQNSYIDKRVTTDQLSYFYQVAARNICGNLVYSAPHQSILLNGKKINDSIMQMNWNSYKGWPQGVSHYNIYRKTNKDIDFSLLTKVQDTTININAGWENYLQCFRVMAANASDTNIISWSNESCFTFDPVLYIPNAFTPNGDPLNENFRVFASFYTSFEMKIYDRWGELVFSTNTPLNQWDGTFKGKKLSDGIFLYIVTVKGFKQSINKSGTFHLLKY